MPFTVIVVIPSPFGVARYSVLTSRFGTRIRTAKAFGAFGFTRERHRAVPRVVRLLHHLDLGAGHLAERDPLPANRFT